MAVVSEVAFIDLHALSWRSEGVFQLAASLARRLSAAPTTFVAALHRWQSGIESF